jgi:hypothetical protein
MAGMHMSVRPPSGPGIGLPFRRKLLFWILLVLIVTVAAIVSYLWCDWGVLSRAGALITVLAACTATFNTRLLSAFVVSALNDYIDPSEDIYQRMRAKPYLYGVSAPLTDEQARELLEQERARHNEKLRAELEAVMGDELRRLELLIAIVGTVLWGFADLINKL